jgi:hypothetical protein
MRLTATLAAMLMSAVIIVQYYLHVFSDWFVMVVVLIAAGIFFIHLFFKYRRP